jgi:hypothetical protein
VAWLLDAFLERKSKITNWFRRVRPGGKTQSATCVRMSLSTVVAPTNEAVRNVWFSSLRFFLATRRIPLDGSMPWHQASRRHRNSWDTNNRSVIWHALLVQKWIIGILYFLSIHWLGLIISFFHRWAMNSLELFSGGIQFPPTLSETLD